MTRRGIYRICPMCGEEGMLLFLGGYGGTLYKCPNCQYVGPIVIEGDEEPSPREDHQRYSANLSKVNSTLNQVGLIFGIVLMGAGLAFGLVVGFSPRPSTGESNVGAYGLALLILGAVLVIASGLFWLGESSRPQEAGS